MKAPRKSAPVKPEPSCLERRLSMSLLSCKTSLKYSSGQDTETSRHASSGKASHAQIDHSDVDVPGARHMHEMDKPNSQDEQPDETRQFGPLRHLTCQKRVLTSGSSYDGSDDQDEDKYDICRDARWVRKDMQLQHTQVHDHNPKPANSTVAL